MDNSNQYETEIDLKQLLFSIFIRWRAVILCGVIFALLFGGYKYISAGQGTVDDQALLEYEQAMAIYEKTMADYQNELDAYLEADEKLAACQERIDTIDELIGSRLTEDAGKGPGSENAYIQLEVLRSLRRDYEEDMEELRAMESPAEPDAEPPAYPSAPSAMSEGLKYGMLGLVLGAFVAAFVICVAELMSDKARDMRDISARYGLRALGELPDEFRKAKGIFAPIDRIIIRIFGYESHVSRDEALSLIAANVDNLVVEHPVRKMLITGFAGEADLEELGSSLTERTNGEVSFMYGGSPLVSTRTVRELASVDAVILAEQRRVSGQSELQSEIALIKDMGKDIFGVVLF